MDLPRGPHRRCDHRRGPVPQRTRRRRLPQAAGDGGAVLHAQRSGLSPADPALSEARPDPALLHALSAIPGAKPLPIVSCDAVYRQTFFKEQLWREQGAVAVDMETSALFSVGAYLGLPVAAALMVSDCHPRREGDSPWSWEMTPALREQLFEAVITAILSIE